MTKNTLTSEISKKLFDVPSPACIKDAYSGKSHPYICITSENASQIKQKALENEWFGSLFSMHLDYVESLLSKSPIPYTHDGTHINPNTACDSSKLAFVYLITGDEKYAEKAWGFAEAVCDYPDWNYSVQYLDTADIVMHMGYVYDALYGYLNAAQKEKLLLAIRQKGLDEALRFYDGTTDAVCLYWSTNRHNWNIVCNGGVITAAAAIFDSDPEYCSEIISKAICSLEYAMPMYLPDGGFEEGSSYWTFAAEYLVCFHDALCMTFDTDFGIFQKYNLGSTAKFPLYMDSDGGTFSVGDAYLYQQMSSDAYYFAIKSGNRALASLIANKIEEYDKSGNLIFFKYFQRSSDDDTEPPLDAYFKKPATGTFREKWSNGGNYVAFHGGRNSLAHGDLDIGTFVFDAGGKRFITDIGRDDYYYPGYFKRSHRYSYYSKRGEGNNVLLVNPCDKYYDQQFNANSDIIRFDSSESCALGILDTAQAYGNDVKKARRGFMLSDLRRVFSVRDEITFTNNQNDIYWFAHTCADIDIVDKGKRAILTISNLKLDITLDCSEKNAVFSVMDAVHISEKTKPHQKYITDLSQYKRLAVHTSTCHCNFFLAVNMALQSCLLDTEKLKLFLPIDKWNV